jgi:hypothetical protein
MAIYVPPSRRKARRILVAVAFLMAGALLGFLVARATAPSLTDQVQSAQGQGRELAAQLRVLALHDEAKALSGNTSTDFALKRTQTDLEQAFAAAPWIPTGTRAQLRTDVADLRRTADQPGFGQRAEAAAGAIEQAFGVAREAAGNP